MKKERLCVCGGGGGCREIKGGTAGPGVVYEAPSQHDQP